MNGLTLRAPVRGFAGYTVVARNLLREIYTLFPETVSLDELNWFDSSSTNYFPEEFKMIIAAKSKQFKKSESSILNLNISCQFYPDYHYAKNFGFSMFETDSLMPDWVDGCNRMDQIFVPSQFNRLSFTKSGVTVPVNVVPLGVDTAFFSPNNHAFSSFPQTFNFLSVAQFIPRKGNDLIISAFLEVFGNNPDVSLLLRWPYDPESSFGPVNFIKNIRNNLGIFGGNIYLIPDIEEKQLNRLYNSAHVLLAPFRGEGWGMPITEALACERPVIATNWGGLTEYLSSDESLLLDYQLRPIDLTHNDFWLKKAAEDNHLWAEPNYEQLKQSLREIYDYYPMYKLKAKKVRKKLVESFQWKHSAEKLLSYL